MTKTILCVVDSSPELGTAVRYACRLAQKLELDIALLYSLEPAAFQHWTSVQNLMREEGRQEAQNILQKWANIVEDLIGKKPVLYIREGAHKDMLLQLLEEERDICQLILAAADHADNPGPLVSAIGGKLSGTLRVPVTIVPGKLKDVDVDLLF